MRYLGVFVGGFVLGLIIGAAALACGIWYYESRLF